MALTDGLAGSQTTTKEFVGDGSTLVYSLETQVKDVTSVENWESGSWTAKTVSTQWSHADVGGETHITYVDGNEAGASVAGVWTCQFDTKANTTDGEFLVVYAKDGTSYAAHAKKTAAAAAAYTVTFEATADTDDGDFIVLTDTNSNRWGISLDTSGSSAEPTSAIWTAIPAEKKLHVDISGATTAVQVAAAVELAIDAVVGFSAVFATDDTAADGTMLFTSVATGALADLEDYATDSITDESSGMTWVETTAGTAGTATPTSSLYTGATNKVVVDLTSATTAADVAAAFDVALTATDIASKITVGTSTDTITFTQQTAGDISDPINKLEDASDDGTMTLAETTEGKTTTCKVTYTQGSSSLKSALTNGL